MDSFRVMNHSTARQGFSTLLVFSKLPACLDEAILHGNVLGKFHLKCRSCKRRLEKLPRRKIVEWLDLARDKSSKLVSGQSHDTIQPHCTSFKD